MTHSPPYKHPVRACAGQTSWVATADSAGDPEALLPADSSCGSSLFLQKLLTQHLVHVLLSVDTGCSAWPGWATRSSSAPKAPRRSRVLQQHVEAQRCPSALCRPSALSEDHHACAGGHQTPIGVTWHRHARGISVWPHGSPVAFSYHCERGPALMGDRLCNPSCVTMAHGQSQDSTMGLKETSSFQGAEGSLPTCPGFPLPPCPCATAPGITKRSSPWAVPAGCPPSSAKQRPGVAQTRPPPPSAPKPAHHRRSPRSGRRGRSLERLHCLVRFVFEHFTPWDSGRTARASFSALPCVHHGRAETPTL